MSKKLRLDKTTTEIIDKFVAGSPLVQVIEKEPGTDKDRFKTTTLFLWGRECISRNMNGGLDLAGNPFIPDQRYKFTNAPIYYNLKDLLIKAFIKGGQDEVKRVYEQHLINHARAKKLELTTG